MSDLVFQLRTRLQAVRRKERLVTWVAGLSRLCLWLLLLLVLYFVVDIWIIRSLELTESYVIRTGLTLVVLALMAWRVIGFLALPLKVPLDDDLMALRVENAHPELRHRLISTLQLTLAAEDRVIGSRELLAALQEDTMTFTRAIPFPAVVKFKPALDWLWKAAVAGVLAVGLCLLFPAHANAFFKRLLFLPQDYPTRMRLQSIDCLNLAGQVVRDEATVAAQPAGSPTNPMLAAGDKVQIRVLPDPDVALPYEDGKFLDGILTYEYTDGPNRGVEHELTLAVPRELVKAARALEEAGQGPDSGSPEWTAFRKTLYWRATIDAVTDPFVARAELDDGRLSGARFQVQSRPIVRSIKVTVTPPEYTRLFAESHDKTGDISALQGSVVAVELTATQKLLHAQLQFADPDVGQKLPQVIKLKADSTTAQDTIWRGQFTVTRNTSYFIDLLATNGLSHPLNPPVYQVVSKLDPLPTIQVRFPRADDTVTRSAKYPIRFAAHDNFNLQEIRLRYRVSDDDNAKIQTLSIMQWKSAGPQDYEGEFRLEIDQLIGLNGRVQEGEVLTLWLEARDTAPDGAVDRPTGLTAGLAESAYTKNYARSNLYRLAVVTAAEKEMELRQKVQEQLDLIQQQADTIKQDRNEKVVPAIENRPAP